MTTPLPLRGSRDWYAWAQWLDTAVRSGGGGGSGAGLVADPATPGLYLITPGGAGLTADPDHPGLYLIGA